MEKIVTPIGNVGVSFYDTIDTLISREDVDSNTIKVVYSEKFTESGSPYAKIFVTLSVENNNWKISDLYCEECN